MAGAPPARLEALSRYGKTAGLAFQIVDDILNETGQSRKLGKPAGSDRVLGKMTFPAAAGLARSRAEVERLTRESVAALGIFGGRARPLADLARYMAGRTA
jgi:geranylgeranyl diphosphate synthase type II